METAAFLFSVVSSLVGNLIYEKIGLSSLPFLQRKKIKSKINEAVAEVIEPILDFLKTEGISDAQTELLISICKNPLW